MIEVLIKWGNVTEIDRSIRMSGIIKEALRESGDFAGHLLMDGESRIISLGLRNNSLDTSITEEENE